MPIDIEILYVADCPNVATARARVHEAVAAAGVPASVREVEVATADEARRVGLRGSPTILVDGHDPFALDGVEPSLSCRLYATAGRLEGAPSVEQLLEVLPS